MNRRAVCRAAVEDATVTKLHLRQLIVFEQQKPPHCQSAELIEKWRFGWRRADRREAKAIRLLVRSYHAPQQRRSRDESLHAENIDRRICGEQEREAWEER